MLSYKGVVLGVGRRQAVSLLLSLRVEGWSETLSGPHTLCFCILGARHSLGRRGGGGHSAGFGTSCGQGTGHFLVQTATEELPHGRVVLCVHCSVGSFIIVVVTLCSFLFTLP